LAVTREHAGAAQLQQEAGAVTVLQLEHLVHGAVMSLAERRKVACLDGRDSSAREWCSALRRADRGLCECGVARIGARKQAKRAQSISYTEQQAAASFGVVDTVQCEPAFVHCDLRMAGGQCCRGKRLRTIGQQ